MRKAYSISALLKLGRLDSALPGLTLGNESKDPKGQFRQDWVSQLSEAGVSVSQIVGRLSSEPDAQIRRMLLLAAKELPLANDFEQRNQLVTRLTVVALADPDDEVRRLAASLAKRLEQLPDTLSVGLFPRSAFRRNVTHDRELYIDLTFKTAVPVAWLFPLKEGLRLKNAEVKEIVLLKLEGMSKVPIEPREKSCSIFGLTLEPLSEGDVVLSLPQRSVLLGSGDWNLPSEFKIRFDSTEPQISRWEYPSGKLINDGRMIRRRTKPMAIAVKFSENVQLANGHRLEGLFKVTGGSAANVRLSAVNDEPRDEVRFEVVPETSGPLKIQIQDGFLQDDAEIPLSLKKQGSLSLTYAPLPTRQEIQQLLDDRSKTPAKRIEQLKAWINESYLPPWQLQCLVGSLMFEEGQMKKDREDVDWQKVLGDAANELKAIKLEQVEVQKTKAGLHACITLARCLVTAGTPKSRSRAKTVDEDKEAGKAREELERIKTWSNDPQFQAQWFFVRGYCARRLFGETNNDVFWHFADSYRLHPTESTWTNIESYRIGAADRPGRNDQPQRQSADVRIKPNANQPLLFDDQVLLESYASDFDKWNQ